MVARGSADAIRVSACDANLRRSNDDDDYLFAGTPNADDSFVKACGITTQRTATLLAIRRRRRWTRWLEETAGKREKKEEAKTARKRRSGGCWRSDGDSENARAKGYEMKFSSHPFCVSEGIPVRQEVPSRNRRKRRKTDWKKRKEERTRSTKRARRRDGGWQWKWRWSEARVVGYQTRGGFHGGGVARETVSKAQIVSLFPKGRYTVHSKISWHMVTAHICRSRFCLPRNEALLLRQNKETHLLVMWKITR